MKLNYGLSVWFNLSEIQNDIKLEGNRNNFKLAEFHSDTKLAMNLNVTKLIGDEEVSKLHQLSSLYFIN